MSSRNAERTFSLRSRLTWLTFLSSGFISILAAAAVLLVSCHYLMSDTDEMIRRLVCDLRGEYAECGGFSPAFIRHMEFDAQEHDIATTFVMLTDAAHNVIYATKIPDGFRKRLLHNLQRGRFAGRFLNEREIEDVGEDRAVHYHSLTLADGNRITVARDVSSVERYLIFLAATLGGSSFLITVLSALAAWTTSSRVHRRLTAVEKAAAQIAQGDWSRRVSETSRVREIRALATAFNAMAANNEKTLNELRVLTDNIAHDLRTPLTRLSLAAETEASGGLLREPLADQVVAEASAMLELINTMLEISQTGAKIDRTPREDLDLTAFVRHACELYSTVAEENGVTLALHAPDAPLHFSGHKGKLQQVLGNLVENALKFTPAGGRIDVTLDSDVVHAAVRLVVADTGCGIAAADVPFVFKRFWRANSSRQLPGNGLGLALVKAIATSYGGTVTCTSEPGKGATFIVSLPMAAC